MLAQNTKMIEHDGQQFECDWKQFRHDGLQSEHTENDLNMRDRRQFANVSSKVFAVTSVRLWRSILGLNDSEVSKERIAFSILEGIFISVCIIRLL
jgi:hypothetical protein